MGALGAALGLLVLLPAAMAAVRLQPEEQPQQSFPYSLPPGQNATNDLSLDEPPLVSRCFERPRPHVTALGVPQPRKLSNGPAASCWWPATGLLQCARRSRRQPCGWSPCDGVLRSLLSSLAGRPGL